MKLNQSHTIHAVAHEFVGVDDKSHKSVAFLQVTPREDGVKLVTHVNSAADKLHLTGEQIDSLVPALILARRVVINAQRDREARKADIKVQLSPNAREFIETIERQQRDARIGLNNASILGDPAAITDAAHLLSELTKRIEAANLDDFTGRSVVRIALEQITPAAIKRALNAFPGYTKFTTTEENPHV